MNQPAEGSNATGRFDALLDLPAPQTQAAP